MTSLLDTWSQVDVLFMAIVWYLLRPLPKTSSTLFIFSKVRKTCIQKVLPHLGTLIAIIQILPVVKGYVGRDMMVFCKTALLSQKRISFPIVFLYLACSWLCCGCMIERNTPLCKKKWNQVIDERTINNDPKLLQISLVGVNTMLSYLCHICIYTHAISSKFTAWN